MVTSTRNFLRGLTFFAFTAIALPATATNGYFTIGYGTKSISMGGTGVASPQDSITAMANSAGMAFVGTRVDAGIRLFRPIRESEVKNGGLGLGTFNEQSGANIFAIPDMGANYQFTRKLSFGFTVAANGGLNTRYNNNFFALTPNAQATGPTLGVDLKQVFAPITVAYKPVKNQAIGVSLNLAMQSFRAYGLQAFGDFGFSGDPDKLTNNGNDLSYGAGVRVGWIGNFFRNKLSLGATWQSKTYMTKFSKYEGLFAKNGKFDVPENYAVGLAIRPVDNLTIAFDVQRILYSDIDSVGNRHPNQCLGGTGVGCTGNIGSLVSGNQLLGESNGIGFGWENMTVYKLGLKYDWDSRLTLRAGYNYGKQPIPDDQILFNFLAPATVEHHLTLGFSYRPSPQIEWTVNYVHAFNNTVSCKAGDFITEGANSGCTTLFTGPGASTAGIEPGDARAKMHQDSIGVSFGYSFM